MPAIVFPGQGSQYLEMTMDFNKNFTISREIFQKIEDITKIDIRKIISKNENDQLNQTNYTQIAIFASSTVIYETIVNEFGLKNINPEVVLGHSLGEYSALVANSSLSIHNASKLIKLRGELMNSAIAPNTSGMAAILGKNCEFIENVIKKHNLNIEVANDNSPMQVVVSGLMKDISLSENIFLNEGVKRFVKLNVSAAFHSRFMSNAQSELNSEIDKIDFLKTSFPIISNFNAQLNYTSSDIINSLKNQMANKVKWTDSIKKLEQTEIKKIIEIGPGKVLSGLISRITKKFDIISIDKITDLDLIK